MSQSPLSGPSDFLERLLIAALSPAYATSIPWMFAAFCLAIVFTLRKRRAPVRVKVMLRATLPRRLFSSPSGRADWAMTLVNTIIAILFFGLVTIPVALISRPVGEALTHIFPQPRLALSGSVVAVVATVAFYLSYELGYWISHFSKHRFEFLWRFHTVHHTAESLSPLTNFRIHPVDSIITFNILAICNGITAGLLAFTFGAAASPYVIYGTNALILVMAGLLGTLQHSHFWILFPRPLNRLLLSPAHHQLHHSIDPAHHNSNYGSTLAIFDWLFGTLTIPPQRRPKLSFGVQGVERPHSAEAMLLRPLSEAAGTLARQGDKGRAGMPAAQSEIA